MMGPVTGLVDAVRNADGFAGLFIVGWLQVRFRSVAIPFNGFGVGMQMANGLAFGCPKDVQ